MLKTRKCISRVEVDQLTRRFYTHKENRVSPISPTRVWSDALFSELKSTCGNRCAQKLCAPPWFIELFTMKKKGKSGESLTASTNEWGISKLLKTNGVKED